MSLFYGGQLAAARVDYTAPPAVLDGILVSGHHSTRTVVNLNAMPFIVITDDLLIMLVASTAVFIDVPVPRRLTEYIFCPPTVP